MHTTDGGLQVSSSPLPEYYSTADVQKEVVPVAVLETRQARNGRSSEESSRKRTFCGLSTIGCGFAIAVITAIVVGAAVGGGVGGTLASCKPSTGSAQSDEIPATVTETVQLGASTTTTVTAATASPYVDYRAARHTEVERLAFDCAPLDNTRIEKSVHELDQTYTQRCDQWLAGNGTLVGIWAYTYGDCVMACTQMNYVQADTYPDRPMPCAGASFTPNMIAAGTDGFGNCYLHDKSSTLDYLGDTVSAVLRD